MPLLDHFRAPLYPLFHWQSFHSHWASILTNLLNGRYLLPEYVAAPHVKMGTEVEIDVGPLELYHNGGSGAGTTTAVYAPPPPSLSVPITFPSMDLFEILIRPEGSARLAAAIEFVRPANKDRPINRRAFAVKCASYLQEGAALAIVAVSEQDIDGTIELGGTCPDPRVVRRRILQFGAQALFGVEEGFQQGKAVGDGVPNRNHDGRTLGRKRNRIKA